MSSIHYYGDIIDLPHPEPRSHLRMSNQDRAAQFMPFAALTGYSAVIDEISRPTEEKVILTEQEKNRISRKLETLQRRLPHEPEANITYFLPDKKKSGGSYQSIQIKIRKIDPIQKHIISTDGLTIDFDNIIRIEL